MLISIYQLNSDFYLVKYQCEDCDKVYKTDKLLTDHIQCIHSTQGVVICHPNSSVLLTNTKKRKMLFASERQSFKKCKDFLDEVVFHLHTDTKLRS